MKNKFPIHVIHVDLCSRVLCSIKVRLNASPAVIDPHPPVQPVQTDLGQIPLLLINFVHTKGIYQGRRKWSGLSGHGPDQMKFFFFFLFFFFFFFFFFGGGGGGGGGRPSLFQVRYGEFAARKSA